MPSEFHPKDQREDRGPAHCWHRLKRKDLLVAALGAALLSSTFLIRPRPLILWNVSRSAPIGLYRVEAWKGLEEGDLVAAFAPLPFRKLAEERGYVPSNVPLVKQVAGVAGDRVCSSGKWLFVNGRTAAARLRADAKGRTLPWWDGCRSLRGDELMLVNSSPDSFDSRYFGPVPGRSVIGRLVVSWAG